MLRIGSMIGNGKPFGPAMQEFKDAMVILVERNWILIRIPQHCKALMTVL